MRWTSASSRPTLESTPPTTTLVLRTRTAPPPGIFNIRTAPTNISIVFRTSITPIKGHLFWTWTVFKIWAKVLAQFLIISTPNRGPRSSELGLPQTTDYTSFELESSRSALGLPLPIWSPCFELVLLQLKVSLSVRMGVLISERTFLFASRSIWSSVLGDIEIPVAAWIAGWVFSHIYRRLRVLSLYSLESSVVTRWIHRKYPGCYISCGI